MDKELIDMFMNIFNSRIFQYADSINLKHHTAKRIGGLISHYYSFYAIYGDIVVDCKTVMRLEKDNEVQD